MSVVYGWGGGGRERRGMESAGPKIPIATTAFSPALLWATCIFIWLLLIQTVKYIRIGRQRICGKVKVCKVSASSYLSVSPSAMEQFVSNSTEFFEIWSLSIFRKSLKKIQVSLKSDEDSRTLHEDQYSIFIISRSVLKMRNFPDRIFRENQNTYFRVSNSLPKLCAL
jgi:hypothetical protein